MASNKISLALQTSFADLAQRIEQAPQAGSVYRHGRGGTDYLSVKIPTGATRIDRLIGPAGNIDVESQAEQYRLGMKLAGQRRKTVSLLRNAGLAGPDRQMGPILDALASAGLFRHGAVLVGTAAYMISEALVGEFLPSVTLATGDVDVATADIALSAEPVESILSILQRAEPSFEAIMGLNTRSPASRFRTEDGYRVDLLMPVQMREQADPTPLRHLSAGATPLQYMAWLIEQPVKTVALYGAGIAVTVPQPARYAVHKLIIAQRRDPANRIKRSKDLAQAEALIGALTASDPFALDDAMDDARSRGRRGWADLIDRSLVELGRN